MRTTTENKMIADPPGCACGRCRAAAAGLGPGPYTPEQYKLISDVVAQPSRAQGPEPEPVRQAAAAVEAAARVYDQATAELGAAVAARNAADRAYAAAPVVVSSDGFGALAPMGEAQRRQLQDRVAECDSARQQAARRLGAAKKAHTAAQRAARRS